MVRNVSDPITVGKRVKSARMLSGFSRREIAEKYGISLPTLRAWENPPQGKGGLTSKGANRLVEALKSAGVICDVNWLLMGNGRGPALTNAKISEFENDLPLICNEEEAIFKEIECFKEVNISPIVVIVKDDCMAPFFSSGDFVGGNQVYENDIENLEGLDCIVETLNEEILIRRLHKGSHKKGYVLTSINPMRDVLRPLSIDVPLKSAAEIIWHRRRRRVN